MPRAKQSSVKILLTGLVCISWKNIVMLPKPKSDFFSVPNFSGAYHRLQPLPFRFLDYICRGLHLMITVFGQNILNILFKHLL